MNALRTEEQRFRFVCGAIAAAWLIAVTSIAVFIDMHALLAIPLCAAILGAIYLATRWIDAGERMTPTSGRAPVAAEPGRDSNDLPK